MNNQELLAKLRAERNGAIIKEHFGELDFYQKVEKPNLVWQKEQRMKRAAKVVTQARKAG